MAARVYNAPQINGSVTGSVQQMQGQSLTINSGAVITGDLYLPGIPNLNKNGNPQFQGIQLGAGSTSPSGYYITLNSGSQLRYLIERTDGVAFNAVPNPTPPNGTQDINVNPGNVSSQIGSWSAVHNLNLNSNVGAVTVPVGSYGTFTANSGCSLILGTTGATTPSTYSFDGLTLNSASNLVVNGPVVIQVKNGVTVNSGCVFGNQQNPAWTSLNITNGGLTLNSNGTLYGFVQAPTSSTNINGTLVGSVVSSANLTVNSGGSIQGQSQNAAQPPTISIVNPTNGEVIQAYTPSTIQATASDPQGTIARVDFYENTGSGAVKVGTSAASPYAVAWSPPPGTYSLTAVATDSLGLTTTSSPVTLYVNFPPSLQTSVSGSVVAAGGSLTIFSGASDSDGSISLVQFYANGQLIGQSTTPPYSFTWTNVPAGPYTITVKATDNEGGLTTSSGINVTSDTPPAVSLTAPVNGAQVQNPANVPLSATATASATSSSISKVAFYADSGGGPMLVGTVTQAPYNFTWSQPAAGAYTLTAVATDNLGISATSAPVHINVLGWNTLTEGAQFLSQQTYPVTIPSSPKTLAVSFRNLSFDKTAQNLIKDGFEISLLGPDGKTLVPTIATGRDAFYNMGETSTVAQAQGVASTTANGITTVYVNVTQVAPGTKATVVARLLNDDSDTKTTVQVAALVQTNVTMPTAQPSAPLQENFPTSAVNFTGLEDLSASFLPVYGQTAYNSATQTLFAGLAIKNSTLYFTPAPLVVVIDQISDSQVEVVNPDGYTIDGLPYFDFSNSLGGNLLAGATSQMRTIEFKDGDSEQFTYRVRFFGVPNHAPVWTSTPVTQVATGQTYTYASRATDPDGNPLTYSLSAGPAGMTINSASGLVSWGGSSNMGTQTVTLHVADGRGGTADQTYVLQITSGQGNLPPVFTSTPVVDATFGAPYAYTLAASDPQNYPLTFALVSGPAGMTLNGSKLTWTPSGTQTGSQNVTVKVSDGHGGTATQSFTINLQAAAGDTPPGFDSTPVTSYALTHATVQTYQYSAHALDSAGTTLAYALLSGPAGASINAQTGVVTWNPTAAGQYPFQIAAYDGHGANAQQNYTLSVTAALNHPPQITSQPVTEVVPGQDYQYGVQATDADNDALTYSLTSSPSGMSINPSTGLIDWLTPANLTGSTHVGIEVADKFGGTVFQVYQITPVATADGAVTGVKFNDLNGNGVQDPGEPGVPGVTMYLDLNGNGQPDPGEPKTLTQSDGSYVFKGVFAGNYVVREVIPPGSYQTMPGSNNAQVTIGSSQEFTYTTTADFNTGTLTNLSATTPLADQLQISDPSQKQGTWEVVKDGQTAGRAWGAIIWNTEAAGIVPAGSSLTIQVRAADTQTALSSQAFVTVTNGAPINLTGRYLDVVATLAITQTVASYSATNDFSLNSDPNGVWSYGWESSLESTFNFDAFSANTYPLEKWYSGQSGDGNPGIYYNNSASSYQPGSEIWQPYQIIMHPGSGGQDSILRWTAPSSGTYTFDTGFIGQDTVGTTTDVHFLLDDSSLFDADVFGYQATQSFDTTLKLNAGDTIDLAVGFGNGSYYYDSTGVSESITNVTNLPEPILSDLTIVTTDTESTNFGNVSPASNGGDLVVQSVDASGVNVDSEALTATGLVKAQIANVGSGTISGSFQVAFFEDVNGNKVYDPTVDNLIGTAQVNGVLPAGQTLSVQSIVSGKMQFANAPVSAYVNFTHVVPETNQNNNYLSNVVAGSLPDILPSDVRATAGSGQSAVYTVRIGNRGGSSTPSGISIAFYNGNPLAGGTFLSAVPTTQVLGTDQYQDVSINLYNGASIDLWIAADDDGSTPGALHGTLTESNKTNNVYHLSAQLVQANLPPHFTSVPVTAAASLSTYRYGSQATSPSNDVLTYSLASGPAGMTIDPVTGYVIWQPTAAQEGATTVVLRVNDGRGGSDIQTYQITVAGAEDAPAIVSIPSTQAVVNYPYEYDIVAQDANNDTISYLLMTSPVGGAAQINFSPTTGKLIYIPNSSNVGTSNVTVAAVNSLGQITTQTFALNVVAQATNRNPVISSTPAVFARLAKPYTYVLEASDPDGDPITSALTQAPSGMTMSNGYVSWTPSAAQYGTNPVTIMVSDDRGGVVTQNFTINVVSATENHPPVITSQPFLAATTGKPYAYNVTATDPDNDTLGYSLTQSPKGMSINPVLGTLRWTPQVSDLGAANVTVQVVDGHGGLVTQSFAITVRGSTLPPVITSSPITAASVNYPYTYAVQASDPQGAPLTFNLNNPPAGMSIDSGTGIIAWTPKASQLGSVPVEVQVQNNQGGSNLQDFTVQVSSNPPVQLPQITSPPVLNLSPGDAYQFQVTVADANPAAGNLTYTLINAPPGMTINPTTGLISWSSTASATIGTDSVIVQVKDAAGGTAILSYNLSVAVSYPPVITSMPVSSIAVQAAYHYQIVASDPQGNSISYHVVQGPAGMTVDGTGVVNWTAATTTGSYPVTLQATNSRGKSAQQSYTLTVIADNQAPTVQLVQTTNVINIGQSVGFQVFAADNVSVQSIKLTVAGTPVGLDANNIATVPFNTGGLYNVVATATDEAGNTASATVTERVLDPTDNHFPTVTVDQADLQAVKGIISQPTSIIATVQDTSLENYEVDIAPSDQIDPTNVAASNPAYKTLATGTANVNDAKVATLDPTVLANGSYFVRVLATNTNGNTNAQGVIVTISGQLKLGRFFYSTTDLNVPLAGIPIQITRTYDSLTTAQSGDFGFGWTLSGVEARVQASVPPPPAGVPNFFASQGSSFRVGSTVTVTGPDGKRENFIFTPQPANLGIPGEPPGFGFFGETLSPAFQPEQGVYDQLTPDDITLLSVRSDGSVGGYLIGTAYYPTSYHLTTKDGHVYHYTMADGLVDEHDRNGVALTFTHTGITSSTGASITYTRDPITDRITAITDPNGKQIQYGYDSSGNLTSVTDQAGRKTQYTYLTTPAHYLNTLTDANGNPIAKTAFDTAGRLSTFTDALGNITTFLYDTVNLIQTKIEPLDPATGQHPSVVTIYDTRGNATQVTNEIGGKTVSTFDGNNNPLTVVLPNGDKTVYSYDATGNQLTQIDSLNDVSKNTFDGNNNLTSVTDPLGHKTTYQYDENGNLTNVVDALGNTTQITSDDLGRPVSLTDALNHTTQFAYTDDPVTGIAATKPSLVTRPDGSTLKFIYNSFGSVTSATDENGNTTQLLTDSGGILQKRIEADGAATNYAYDANGNLTDVTDALGKVTHMDYDAAFHLKKRTGPNGEVTQFTYDQLGRLSSKIDPLNRTTVRHYRADGVLASITQPDNTVIGFDNDANGRRTGVTDPDGNHTTFTYNGNSQVLTQTDPLSKVTQYAYDASGNLTSVIDRLGRVRQFAYNANNQLTTETWLANLTATSPLKTISTSYDAVGDIAGVSDDTGALVMQYDQRNRVQTFTTNYTGRSPFVLTYGYDVGSRVTSVTDGDGVQVGTSYDQRNNANQVTWQGRGIAASAHFSHDPLGDLTNIKRYADTTGSKLIGQTTFSYTRNLPNIGYQAAAFNAGGDQTQTASFAQTEAFGPLQNDADANALLTNVTQPLARLGGVTHQDGNGNTIEAEGYANDAAGQLQMKTVGSDSATYGYDQTGQLKSTAHTTVASLNENYTYDPSGNRTTTGAQKTANTVTASNRITADLTYTYTYDGEGNLATKTTTATGSAWTYSYDLRNRLTSATQTAGNHILSQASYIYDALDRRIAKTVNGAPSQYFYQGDNLWKLSGSGGTTRYLTGGAVDQWVARATTSGVSWYLTDRLGSVTGITDATGALINSTAYDSYGHILSQSNPAVADQLAFTGREFDAETGLYYFRARYYNPDLGRFQSEDPIKFGANDFNWARFVGNTPTGHKDPFGLSPIIETRTIDLRTLGVVQEEGETALAFGRRVHQIIQTLAKVANPNLESEVSFEGFGRADLFSEEDNLIIEIKPFNTAGADAGHNQLISYYGGVLNEGLADETTEYTLRLLLYF